MDEIEVTDFQMEDAKLVHIAQQPAYKMDDQLHVRFSKHAELNSFRSKEEGRKIFDEKIYVRILMPANRLTEIYREASEDDKVRFAAQYQRFIAGLEQLTSGTPISELPQISPAQVLELKALKCDTIEQLATMPDHTVQLLGLGGLTLKNRAQSFLARAKSTDDLVAQNSALKAEIDELRALINARLTAEDAAKNAKPDVQVKAG